MVRALTFLCATQVSAVHQPSVHAEVGAHGEAQFSLDEPDLSTLEIGQEEEGMWMVPATSQEHVSALEVSAGPSSSDWVQAHNAERCKYDAGNVVWNSAVAANAQRVATENARINQMQHSNSYGSTPSAGENIYASASSSSAPAANAATAVNKWTSEVVNCPSDNSGCQQSKAGCVPSSSNAHCQVGHFTAVVWKGTTEIGCGSASATSAKNGFWWTYTVCQYANSPPNFNKATQAPLNVDITASPCNGVAPPTRRRAPPRRRAPTPPRRRASSGGGGSCPSADGHWSAPCRVFCSGGWSAGWSSRTGTKCTCSDGTVCTSGASLLEVNMTGLSYLEMEAHGIEH